MKLKNLLIPIVLLSITSCRSNTKEDMTIYCPTGAPAYPLYDFIINEKAETASAPSVIPHFITGQADIIVYETLAGLKAIRNNNANYRLAFNITGGNTYLVGMNKDSGSTPKEDDYIVSFMEGSIPDLAFKKVYGNIVDSYVSTNELVAPILKSGKFESQTVDYVVIAEPSLSTVINSAPEYLKKYTITSIRDAYGDKFDTQKIIPQAAVFVNLDSLTNKNELVISTLSKILSDSSFALNNPLEVKTIVDNKLSKEDQKSKFGFVSDIVYNAQKDNKNGIGLIKDVQNFDLSQFLKNIGISENYDDLFLKGIY